jgi:hemerythrin-like domain-containing protein
VADDPPSSLLDRQGLPDDLLFLLRKYRREQWSLSPGIDGTARFWLDRHAMFRELGGMLAGGIDDYREGRRDARQFAAWFVPRLNAFLTNLEGHHHVEDQHYFPMFARAEPRLVRGFDILDGDHHLIHAALEANAEAANALLRAIQGDDDARRRGADAYADANARLVAMLARHLDDEEDLVIPLILDRGF